ncbi:MAG: hypothetical protein EOP84_25825, partial [Verrucomicrobiaceae bacterium]
MKITPTHLKRYSDVALLLYKYSRTDIFKDSGFDAPEGEAVGHGKAEDLAGDLEKLGPTFVKIGQLLSTRSDLLPPAYLEALTRLQDKVDPVPYEQIEEGIYSYYEIENAVPVKTIGIFNTLF